LNKPALFLWEDIESYPLISDTSVELKTAKTLSPFFNSIFGCGRAYGGSNGLIANIHDYFGHILA
jgi:hypothetical protein